MSMTDVEKLLEYTYNCLFGQTTKQPSSKFEP